MRSPSPAASNVKIARVAEGTPRDPNLPPLRLYGRYGKDQKPGDGKPLTLAVTAQRNHVYAQTDYDEAAGVRRGSPIGTCA